MKKMLLLNDKAIPDFLQFIKLTKEQLHELHSFLRRKGFEIGIESCWELGTLLGVQSREAIDLLTISQFLFDQVQKFNFTNEELVTAIQEAIQNNGQSADAIKVFEAQREDYIALLRDPVIQEGIKIRDLQSGIIKYASDFKSFCDYRPLFSADRKEIKGFVPAILVRIRTKDDFGEKQDIIFQLNEDSLNELIEFTTDIKKKLTTLKKYEGEKIKIIGCLGESKGTNVESK
jgi:hypothetical protein